MNTDTLKQVLADHARWIMQRGTPDRVIMSARNYTLLTRAANFFVVN